MTPSNSHEGLRSARLICRELSLPKLIYGGAWPLLTHIWGAWAPANSYMGARVPQSHIWGCSSASGPGSCPAHHFPPGSLDPGLRGPKVSAHRAWLCPVGQSSQTSPAFRLGVGGWMPSSNSVCGRRSQDTCGRDLRPSVWVRGRKEEGVCTCVREPMHVCVKHTSIGPWPHSVIPKPVYSRKCKRVYSDHGGGSGRWQWSLRKPCG